MTHLSKFLASALCTGSMLCGSPVAAQLPTDAHTRLNVPSGFETEHPATGFESNERPAEEGFNQ